MDAKKSILVVEDEPGIVLSLRDELEDQGYRVYTAEDGETALRKVRDYRPDLVILDIMLPRLDGYEVCQRLRAAGDRTPIIMLTVKDKEIDKVLGLELGADDYVTKPFSLRELTARIKAVLRRREIPNAHVHFVAFGAVEINFMRYEAKKNSRELPLTPLEFHMLELLIRRKGEVISRDEFLDAIWGRDNLAVSHRTIDSHIANIRRKIEENPASPRHILSVRAVGYKFSD